MMKLYIMLLCGLRFLSSAIAQQTNYTIRFKKEPLELQQKNLVNARQAMDFESARYGEYYYLLVQFHNIPTHQEQQELVTQGIELLTYIPNYAYTTKVQKSALQSFRNHTNVRAIVPFPIQHKFPEQLPSVAGTFEVAILLNEALSEAEAKNISQGKYTKFLSLNDKLLTIQTNANNALEIAALPVVAFVQQQHKVTPLGYTSNANANAGRSTRATPNGRGLSGDGVHVSVGDGGTILDHVDLNNRVANYQSTPENGHGANVCGIIAGEGVLDPKAIGIAPQSTIHMGYYTEVISQASNYFTNSGVVISNNSYGSPDFSNFCQTTGIYDTNSASVDGALNTLDEVVHVFAAGNSGGTTCSPLPAGHGTVFNGFQAAKNVVTVGSINTSSVISSNSSRGPVKDGRIKPELVAIGEGAYTTNTNNNYSSLGAGTSFSTPVVVGGLALLYEQYKTAHSGANPRGDLMKAVVCNSARDLGNTGPDYTYGFGALDMQRATDIVANSRWFMDDIANAANKTHTITVPANTTQLKVMLYWHDKEASAGAATALINNLDLTLTDASNTVTQPYILDANNPASVATRGVDNLNNIEQVVIDNPTAGTYTVKVAGTNIPVGVQDYVVVYDMITPNLDLQFPLGGELFTPGETINATWSAAGHNSDDFTLEYSVDNGSTWATVSSTIAGTTRNHDITLPSTPTDKGLVKITWSNNGLTSQSIANFTIMGVPSNFVASPSCDGQVDMSWNMATGADSYDVLEYTSNAWSVLANTTSLTYNVTGLASGTSKIYAVRAKTSGGLVGQPSSPQTIVATNASSITSFPYSEDFENGNGGWYAAGKNNQWALGTPTTTIINSAASGTNAWATNLTGNYANGSASYLYSPCFDLSGTTSPVIAFSLIYDIEKVGANDGVSFWDYAELQYSTNGKTWTRLGTNGSGQHWYNNTTHKWFDEKGYWHIASNDIPTQANRVQFRFALIADAATNEEGIAIDDVQIYDKDTQTTIYTGADTQIDNTVSGSNWIDYISGGNIIASIHANGNNLGNTSVNVYRNTSGVLRDNGVQYYMNRNWKITPTTAPMSGVKVRLYFTQAELNDIIAKTGGTCTTCSTVTKADELGITKYSGNNEDGELANNNGAGYTFFTPSSQVDIFPYKDGYYMEFETSSFSEFYANGGGINANQPLPVELQTFTAYKYQKDAVLEWSTASELNTSHFEIEVSQGGMNDYQSLGRVEAVGNSTTLQHYRFVDTASPKNGIRYYRLKMVDKDGTYEYSPVKVVGFDTSFSLEVYPNPTKRRMTLKISSPVANTTIFTLRNILGQKVYTQRIQINQGTNKIENVLESLNIKAGMYVIEVQCDGKVLVQPIVIE